MPNTVEFKRNLSKIKAVISHATTNPLSDLYTKKYQGRFDVSKVVDYDDFLKIPVISRDELLAVPWEDRCFIPLDEIAYVGITSGTTNHNLPMTVPISKKILRERTENIEESTISPNKVHKLGIKRVLSLIPGALNFYYAMMYFPDCGAIPIPGDFRDLNATARLCKQLDCDGIMTIPTLLINLSTELINIGFPLTNIKWISLQGELISEAKLAHIKKLFPKARVEIFYGSNEMTNRAGYPCNKRDFEINTYHPGSKFFFEILDDDRNPLPPGEIGNLVATDLDDKKPLPLIRYWTGDLACIEDVECSCGNHRLLRVGGRSGYEQLRIFGVTFSSVVFENAIKDLLPEILHYEIHISESTSNNVIRPKVEIFIHTNTEFSKIKLSLEQSVYTNFYISKDKTIKRFIDDGIFEPLVISQLKGTVPAGKSKKIYLDT